MHRYTREIAIAIGPSKFKRGNSMHNFAYNLCEEAQFVITL